MVDYDPIGKNSLILSTKTVLVSDLEHNGFSYLEPRGFSYLEPVWFSYLEPVGISYLEDDEASCLEHEYSMRCMSFPT